MDVSGDVNLYTTIMEKILISTNGMSLAELGAATTETQLRALEAAASSHSDEGTISSGYSLEDEGLDDITPLAGDTTKPRTPSLRKRESRTHRQSMARRSTIREVRERRQSALQMKGETSKVEEKLAAEILRRTILEEEILELERLLDEQEDEISDLDRLVAKYKSKNQGLSDELKTKSRTILILEEKYSMLKTERSALRARNDNLQLKLAQAEEDRSMKIMQLTSDNADGQEDINSLKREIKDCNNSLAAMRQVIGEKDMKLLATMEDMDTLRYELKMVKKDRDELERSLKAVSSPRSPAAGEVYQESQRSSLRKSIVAQIRKVGKTKKKDKPEKTEKKKGKPKSDGT